MSAHPKAAMCALMGLRPFVFGRLDDVWPQIRIGETPVKTGAPALYLRPPTASSKSIVSRLSDWRSYRSIEWDDIPEELWDNVPYDLITKLFNLIGEKNEREQSN